MSEPTIQDVMTLIATTQAETQAAIAVTRGDLLAELATTRSDIMARIDRLQNRVDAIHDDIVFPARAGMDR